ncbi:unnamed protein product [Mytilus coruscus]|uniref:Uncharacterized protein n=1 Tax=Mytilus coruscus TaxID=42192 RepID=A0A6J8BWZ7_MYTCO|nr:unnamed protein product [Mytilus coruscus]
MQGHICKAYDQIADHLNRIPQCSTIEDLETVQKELAICGEKHSELCLNLIDFCQRRGTLASKELAQTHRMTHQGCRILIDSATRQIKNRINDITFEQRSTVSSSSSKSSLRSSASSRQSEMSSVILRTRAKAKVATTRLKFVELETEMKKKQASLDEQKARADREKANLAAELDLLEAKREAAAVEAEVDALSESPVSSEASVKYELNIQSEPLDAKARTKTYVQQLNSAKQDVQTGDTNNNQHFESSYRVTETNLDPRVEPFIPSQSVAESEKKARKRTPCFRIEVSGTEEKKDEIFGKFASIRQELTKKNNKPMGNLQVIEALLQKWNEENDTSNTQTKEFQEEPCPSTYIRSKKVDTNQHIFLTAADSFKRLISVVEWHARCCKEKLKPTKMLKKGHVCKTSLKCNDKETPHVFSWSSSPFCQQRIT